MNTPDMKYTLMMCCLLLALGSCVSNKADQQAEPQTTKKIEVDRIWQCHDEQNPQPSQINAGLEGTWVWQSSACYWDGHETKSANKQVVITFNDGGLYKVFEDSKIESEGEWNLSKIDGGWTLHTSKPSTYLHGYVLLCGDEVIFYSSYIDGCDYYFTRR